MRAPLLLVVWLAVAAPATAYAERLEAHVAAAGGVKFPSGRVGDAYPIGFLTGIEAGYQPFARIGLQWTLLFGYYPASEQSVNDLLVITDLNFALSVRAIEAQAYSVCLNAGVNIVRSDAPIPPTDDRTFFGPSVGVASQYTQGDFYFAVSGNYGLLTDDPAGLSFLISVGVGSR